ncbi:MAG: class I SAM-dependent methyltransferase [Desulfobacter sp.]|nr:MAG: class I SAM-dependent methyltransferase [Desulfobacter sp.]
MKTKNLYLELLKDTLNFALWDEPGMPIETFAYKKSKVHRTFLLTLVKFFRLFNYQIVKLPKSNESDKEDGKVWPRYGESMVGRKRLDNIQYCVETVLKEDIKGDFIETGVWRGGAVILMKAILKSYNISDRIVYVADSFEGLPKPDEEKYPLDIGDIHYTEDFLAVSEDIVKSNFEKYGLLDENVHFLKGWFKDTLPTAPIDKLSVLRIDGDMYESTMDAITNLYPKLSDGGFCIIDDYVHPPCKKAVDIYRKEHKIESPIESIDWTGVYWRK